jgi:hypothetical protein
LDEALGQDAREVSAGVVRLVAEFGAHLSFGTSAALLEKAQPAITLSARQVETIAEAVGEQAACLKPCRRRSSGTATAGDHTAPASAFSRSAAPTAADLDH